MTAIDIKNFPTGINFRFSCIDGEKFSAISAAKKKSRKTDGDGKFLFIFIIKTLGLAARKTVDRGESPLQEESELNIFGVNGKDAGKVEKTIKLQPKNFFSIHKSGWEWRLSSGPGKYIFTTKAIKVLSNLSYNRMLIPFSLCAHWSFKFCKFAWEIFIQIEVEQFS